jgi:hypothetical protein
MDDIYADNTLARVVVGNASTYASLTHRELQIPSAWSNSSIAITVNKGSFRDNDCAYLYVIDDNGIVNSNGYKISGDNDCTISADPVAPAAPTGLRIVD